MKELNNIPKETYSGEAPKKKIFEDASANLKITNRFKIVRKTISLKSQSHQNIFNL